MCVTHVDSATAYKRVQLGAKRCTFDNIVIGLSRCDDVYIADVQIVAPRDEGIPNDDGIDPDSCSNVLVERCLADVGDNSVAIKSGKDLAGRKFNRPSANIVMRDSKFVCETWAIGSEMSGGVFNITIDNCEFGGNRSDFVGFHWISLGFI